MMWLENDDRQRWQGRKRQGHRGSIVVPAAIVITISTMITAVVPIMAVIIMMLTIVMAVISMMTVMSVMTMPRLSIFMPTATVVIVAVGSKRRGSEWQYYKEQGASDGFCAIHDQTPFSSMAGGYRFAVIGKHRLAIPA